MTRDSSAPSLQKYPPNAESETNGLMVQMRRQSWKSILAMHPAESVSPASRPMNAEIIPVQELPVHSRVGDIGHGLELTWIHHGAVKFGV